MSRRALLTSLAILSLQTALPMSLPAGAADDSRFVVAMSLPWYEYGDVGGNAWGHRGFSSGGFSTDVHRDSRGFVSARRVETNTISGKPALAVTLDLDGRLPGQSSGEVGVNIQGHLPGACTSTPSSENVNLDGVTVRMKVCFPENSSGPRSAPNGVQFTFKTKTTGGFASFYSPWQNIDPAWEGRCVELVLQLSNSAPGQREPEFDASRVARVGFKIGINSASAAVLKGTLYLESYVLGTNPPIVFDFQESTLERDFRSIRQISQAAGSSRPVARVFIFTDGRAGIRWAADGTPVGLDLNVFEDFDALLAAAVKAGVQVMPVLIDFPWFRRARNVEGVQLGGHSDVILDAGKRKSFLDQVLEPLLLRYGKHPAIYAWEIGNELEWAAEGIPGLSPAADYDTVQIGRLREFVAMAAARIQQFSGHEITIGSARRSWLSLWQGLGLTQYSFHYYDSDREEAFPWRSGSELGLDRPVLVGEVPTAGSIHSASDYVLAARNGGYAGLSFWSCRAGDGFSDFSAATLDLTSRFPATSAQ